MLLVNDHRTSGSKKTVDKLLSKQIRREYLNTVYPTGLAVPALDIADTTAEEMSAFSTNLSAKAIMSIRAP